MTHRKTTIERTVTEDGFELVCDLCGTTLPVDTEGVHRARVFPGEALCIVTFGAGTEYRCLDICEACSAPIRALLPPHGVPK